MNVASASPGRDSRKNAEQQMSGGSWHEQREVD